MAPLLLQDIEGWAWIPSSCAAAQTSLASSSTILFICGRKQKKGRGEKGNETINRTALNIPKRLLKTITLVRLMFKINLLPAAFFFVFKGELVLSHKRAWQSSLQKESVTRQFILKPSVITSGRVMSPTSFPLSTTNSGWAPTTVRILCTCKST